jgi:transcriptional regulator with XRE-family HTH domain
MAAWSDEEFLARVEARCKELGKSQREVLRKAGLAHDYLTPRRSRRIDQVERITEVLDWKLSDILGLEPRTPGFV